jgi:hypothetical protein
MVSLGKGAPRNYRHSIESVNLFFRFFDLNSSFKCSVKQEGGLDEVSLKLLGEEFAPLDELARQLPSRVMRYLLEGTEGNVLAELAALKQAGQKLGLYGLAAPKPGEGGSASVPPAQGESPRRRFFQSLQCAAPVFFVRLGRVYEAASRPLRFRMMRAFGDPDLDWLQVLLIEATQFDPNSWPRHCRPCAVLTAELIEAMLQAEGQPRDLLVRAAFQPPAPAWTIFGPELAPVWECLPGLGASAGRHPAAVLAALSQADFRGQLQALNLMKKCQAPPGAFLGKLLKLAVGPSERVRAQAVELLGAAAAESGPFWRERAIRGRSEERACAARFLWRAEGEKARAFLGGRGLQEKSKKVLRVLRELLKAAAPEPGPDATMFPELPSWWKLALGPAEGRLARFGTAPAIAPLLAALKKEKNQAVKSAMMTSLAQLGVAAGQFLDRDGLLEESVRGLAKEFPEQLSWFPFQRLPPVHWADGGLVEAEIMRFWLAQCCQRHSPEPGPLLRQYAANLQREEREALGQFVLEAWINQDIEPIAPLAPRPAGSALAGKGVLALAGAYAGAGAAPLVRRYLEEWYGRRATQCRALLQMLAWVEHPAAARLLLAVAGGFRTPIIQEEAARLAVNLAERKGCTVAELEQELKLIDSSGFAEYKESL